jgi:hypothetical protein
MDEINNREHSRFSFPAGSWVKIVIKGQSANDFKMYELIDISQGGISFKSHVSHEFKRGVEFYVMEIGGKIIKEALLGKVRYVKPLNELKIELKVGAEFIERL